MCVFRVNLMCVNGLFVRSDDEKEKRKTTQRNYNWCDAGLCVTSFTQPADQLRRTKTATPDTQREKKQHKHIWFINFIIKLLFTQQTKTSFCFARYRTTRAYQRSVLSDSATVLPIKIFWLFRRCLSKLNWIVIFATRQHSTHIYMRESHRQLSVWLKCILHRMFWILWANFVETYALNGRMTMLFGFFDANVNSKRYGNASQNTFRRTTTSVLNQLLDAHEANWSSWDAFRKSFFETKLEFLVGVKEMKNFFSKEMKHF